MSDSKAYSWYTKTISTDLNLGSFAHLIIVYVRVDNVASQFGHTSLFYCFLFYGHSKNSQIHILDRQNKRSTALHTRLLHALYINNNQINVLRTNVNPDTRNRRKKKKKNRIESKKLATNCTRCLHILQKKNTS